MKQVTLMAVLASVFPHNLRIYFWLLTSAEVHLMLRHCDTGTSALSKAVTVSHKITITEVIFAIL